MAQMLDLNNSTKYVLPVKLTDEAQTVVLVTPPAEKWVESLEHDLPDLLPKLSTGDKDATDHCYALTAELLNFNRSGLVFTAENLRTTYNFNFFDLLVFLQAYMDFVSSIANEKN